MNAPGSPGLRPLAALTAVVVLAHALVLHEASLSLSPGDAPTPRTVALNTRSVPPPAHLGEQPLHLRQRGRQVGAALGVGDGLQPAQLVLDHGADAFQPRAGRQVGCKAAPRGRCQQRHHVAQAQVDRAGQGGFLPVHDGRTMVAPDRQRQRVANPLQQRAQALTPHLHRVKP